MDTSRYKGVCWNKRRRKWVATISVNNRRAELGGFADERLAALTYDKAAIRYGYKTNILKKMG